MKNHFRSIIAVTFALILSFMLASPAQAYNLKQSPSGNPGCTKNVFGFMNCDRANAWGIAADLGLASAKQKNDTNRALAMKNAVTVIVTPIGTKAQVDGIRNVIPNRINVNQALCMKEELQRTTNRITAKSKLVKNYYSYLGKTSPLWKKAPLGNVYASALKNSKSVATGVMQATERNETNVGLHSCISKR